MTSEHDTSQHEREIRAIEAAYDEAWARGDANALAAALAEDAVVVNPRGEVAVGRAEFEAIMRRMLAGPFAGSVHTSRLERVRFVAADVAIVDGVARITGIRDEPAPIVHPFTDVFVRRDGRWAISDVRAYTFLSGG